MPAPEIIHQLVANFEQNREAYRSGKYNEARLRQEFLDKFFEALGWDVYNKNGYAPENCEVLIEDSLEIEGTSKAPDYTFRMGRERKFFVEAKKPAVNIKYDIHPAYQLRRYAWNAHMPLSILTDFEELAVYNCKSKPDPKDSAATARDKFFHYTEYIDRWDELAAIFSRDAVWKGSFDKFASESKGKKGTTEVDDEILKDIENWRILLAHNIALRNKPLIKDEDELNYAVQMTIDRILFLRICEDRAIEPGEQLKTLAASPGIYLRLVELFRRADTKYNSGLFHLHPEKDETTPADTFTPSLTIDDKVLKEIISDIYYPCPYIFKEIPVEILGQVYEQFLGKVIRLTPAGQAKVEDKPEVRKAGGVYYTPTYIVDYIVQNTVGELLKDKTPAQASALKIVDPACGSGSFLLGAFKYLLNWHYEYYTNNQPETLAKRKNTPIYPVGGGWRLTTAEKKRILTNNLFGVDIDPQAVEVTKLSLLLKVLEEESGQLSLGIERVLPDLGHNIQCGNSLIGWDYFEGQLTIDEEERKRVNPFDWQRTFPQVFSQGGFDVVIGNPPYIDSEWLSTTQPDFRNYCVKKYFSAKGNWDIYCVFIEKASLLCSENGLSSMIVPNKLLSADYAKSIRQFLINNNEIVAIRDYSKVPVFPVGVYPIVYVIRKRNGTQKDNGKFELIIDLFPVTVGFTTVFQQENIKQLGNKSWSVLLQNENAQTVDQIYKKGIRLVEIATVNGAASVAEAYNLIKHISDYSLTDNNFLKFINTGTIDRYSCLWGRKRTTYIKKTYEKPILAESSWRHVSKSRLDQANKQKIIIGGMNKFLECYLDNGDCFPGKSTTVVISQQIDQFYLLGLLNSKLLSYLYKAVNSGLSLQGGYFRVGPPQIKELPIYIIQDGNQNEIVIHTKIINLVQRMLDLHKNIPATPQEQARLTRDIAATDHAIDTLVYQLYDLTPAEIAIIEGN